MEERRGLEMYSDREIHDEIEKLENNIAYYTRELTSLPNEVAIAQNKIDEMNHRTSNYVDQCHQRGIYGFETIRTHDEYKFYDKERDDAFQRRSNAEININKYTKNKLTDERKRIELLGLLPLSLEQRKQIFYERFIDEKKAAFEKKEIEKLSDIADQFIKMGAYKNSAELAEECKACIRIIQQQIEDEKARKRARELREHYNELIQSKENASTESDYKNLAEQFRVMKGYKNTAELADECDKQYRTLVKLRNETKYKKLLKKGSLASGEIDFKNLADEFRSMHGYKNTIELATRCENRYNVLKERREAQEKKELEEREAAKRRLWLGKIFASIIGFVLSCIPVFIFNYIYFNRYNIDVNALSDKYGSLANIGSIIGMICHIVAPALLILTIRIIKRGK